MTVLVSRVEDPAYRRCRAGLRPAVMFVSILLVAGGAAVAQEAAPPAAKASLSPEQIEAFLLNARIVSSRGAGNGVTNSRRVTMTDGTITHDAHVQTVDISRNVFEAPGAAPELNFKDTFRYNIAGYRLARLLGMDNVPASVERKVEGKSAAVTWWIDDVMMDELTRRKKAEPDRSGPNPQRTAMQLAVMRVFDELIQNRDRNAGNLLWTSDWKMWLIDHTRAFRLGDKLLKPEQIQRCDRALCDAMRKLTKETLVKAMDRTLTGLEMDAILDRRDAILKQIDDRIVRRGEAVVMFSLPAQ
jgi:hypothetical protein